MAHYDATNAECTVSTFKEGLLSAVAHDLSIRVESFELDVDDATRRVTARFDARSLRVVGAVRDGAVDGSILGDGDRKKIERAIVEEVLHAERYSAITFASSSITETPDGYRIQGELKLHGATRPVAIDARPSGGRIVAELRLHQPDFDIRPFSAMLGTLKVKPEVIVRCSVTLTPPPAGGPG